MSELAKMRPTSMRKVEGEDVGGDSRVKEESCLSATELNGVQDSNKQTEVSIFRYVLAGP